MQKGNEGSGRTDRLSSFRNYETRSGTRAPLIRASPGSEEVLQNLGDEKNLPEFFEHGGAGRLNRRGGESKIFNRIFFSRP
jgi:hypothetical protein